MMLEILLLLFFLWDVFEFLFSWIGVSRVIKFFELKIFVFQLSSELF